MNELISIEKTAEKITNPCHRGIGIGYPHFFRGEGPHIQFRIDNKLVPQETLSFFEAERLIAHLKFLASMDIGEKKEAPEWCHHHQFSANQVVGLRLSTLPTAHLESLVIRLIPQQNILPLEQLSLFPNTVQKLIALLKHSHGMLIFTGPTMK